MLIPCNLKDSIVPLCHSIAVAVVTGLRRVTRELSLSWSVSIIVGQRVPERTHVAKSALVYTVVQVRSRAYLAKFRSVTRTFGCGNVRNDKVQCVWVCKSLTKKAHDCITSFTIRRREGTRTRNNAIIRMTLETTLTVNLGLFMPPSTLTP